MSMQEEYRWWVSGDWAYNLPPGEECPCRGSGWACSDLDTWHECPRHYKGQPHPEWEL